MKNNTHIPVVFQGVAGAHSQVSLVNFSHKNNLDLLPQPQEGYFEDLFATLLEDTGIGWLPIENSYAGDIMQSIDFLRNNNVKVFAGYDHAVEHCLAAIPGADIDSIKRVFSHPQALSQCKKFLAEHNLQAESYNDTAAAARFVSEQADPTTACLCSSLAVEEYGLHMLAPSVQDDAANTTRFFLAIDVSRTDLIESLNFPRPSKTVLIFETLDNHAALYAVLEIFAKQGLSLAKISSRPTSEKAFSYFFYCEIHGTQDDSRVAHAFTLLDAVTQSWKIVGEY